MVSSIFLNPACRKSFLHSISCKFANAYALEVAGIDVCCMPSANMHAIQLKKLQTSQQATLNYSAQLLAVKTPESCAHLCILLSGQNEPVEKIVE